MKHKKEYLNDLSKEYTRTDYKDGGNFSGCYYSLPENSFVSNPEITVNHAILNCTYLESNSIIPIKLRIWTKDRFKTGTSITFIFGSYISTENFSPNFIQDYLLEIPNTVFLTENILIVSFLGLNKFNDVIEYNTNIQINYNTNCNIEEN